MNNLSFYSFHSDDPFCAFLPQVKAKRTQNKTKLSFIVLEPVYNPTDYENLQYIGQL